MTTPSDAISYDLHGYAEFTGCENNHVYETQEIYERISPLLETLAAYDRARTKLETKGGHASEFNSVARILNTTIEMDRGRHKVFWLIPRE